GDDLGQGRPRPPPRLGDLLHRQHDRPAAVDGLRAGPARPPALAPALRASRGELRGPQGRVPGPTGRRGARPFGAQEAGLSEAAGVLARRFWPGPLTLVVPRACAVIPDIVAAGRGTVGLRIPAPEVARRLIGLAGRPVAAPSANRSTGISPTEAWHVLDDLDG